MIAPSPLILANQAWLSWPESVAVMKALNSDAPDMARFVGGAVRDAVLGRAVKDIDIATKWTPQAAVEKLQAAGIKVVPTGIDHGTITAVVGHRPFEITTLRRDVATDGRRATVAFTDDWTEDAARRDFTMNALYADMQGQVFDPFGGVADAQAGRVRFIGDAETRIEEDALRILRFFRFHAWYGENNGQGAPDADGLAACVKRRADLCILSVERVATELLRLLAAPSPAPTVRLMASQGILAMVLPEAAYFDRLDRLVVLEQRRREADALRRLGALLPDGGAAVGDRLRLPKRDQLRLAEMVMPREDIAPERDGSGFGRRLRALHYRIGKQAFVDHALLNWAGRSAATDDKRWRDFLRQAENWPAPVFPLKGRDALALGAAPGPQLGDLLAELELWWISRDFKPTKADLLKKLEKRLAANSE